LGKTVNTALAIPRHGGTPPLLRFLTCASLNEEEPGNIQVEWCYVRKTQVPEKRDEIQKCCWNGL